MTHTELKRVILDYILDTYKMEFVGTIKIEDLNPQGYKVSLNFNNSENPLVLIADYPDEEFIQYIKNEIRSRKFQRTKYYKTTKLPRRL